MRAVHDAVVAGDVDNHLRGVGWGWGECRWAGGVAWGVGGLMVRRLGKATVAGQGLGAVLNGPGLEMLPCT